MSMSLPRSEIPISPFGVTQRVRTMSVNGHLIDVPAEGHEWWKRRTSGYYVWIDSPHGPVYPIGLLFYETDDLQDAIRSVVRIKLLGCTRMFLITDHKGVRINDCDDHTETK